MRKMKSIVGVILSICVFFSMNFSTLADGAKYWEYGVRYKNIAVKSYSSSYNDTWVSILNNARSAWNSSSAGTTITTSSTSGNKILATRYDDTWYGLFSVESSSQVYITKFTIQVNARTISNAATNFSNFAKSTVVHEFGHAYFLDDNPPTTQSTIMSHSRNRNSLTTPQSYDVNNVIARYELIP